MKHRLLLIAFLMTVVLAGHAQQRPFNPAKFEAELEQFVATEAALTPQESSRFFPIYREMR